MDLNLNYKTILLASNNSNKIEELKSILNEILGVRIITLNDINITIDIIEDGETLEENAYIKAKTINNITNLPVIADDTGLEVLELNKKPGVLSARYAGKDCNSKNNRIKLLNDLTSIKNRNASFKTVICFVDEFNTIFSEGEVRGKITYEEKGENGFGYDKIFELEINEKTYAEMTIQEKNYLSHRALAINDLKRKLTNLINS